MNNSTSKDKWIRVSEPGIWWYDISTKELIYLPECTLSIQCKGRDILIHNKSSTYWFGYIRESFVGPDYESNFEEMKEWFEEYSSPYTIGIKIKEKVEGPDNEKIIADSYYAIRLANDVTYTDWIDFVKTIKRK